MAEERNPFHSQFRRDFDQQLGDFQLYLETGNADSAVGLLLGLLKLLADEIEKGREATEKGPLTTSPPCDSPNPARPPLPSEH